MTEDYCDAVCEEGNCQEHCLKAPDHPGQHFAACHGSWGELAGEPLPPRQGRGRNRGISPEFAEAAAEAVQNVTPRTGPPSLDEHVYLPTEPTDTQIQAADVTLPRSGTQRRRVYDALVTAGDAGLTDEEMQLSLEMNPSTVRPRRLELVEEHLVRDSGQRRRVRSGELAIVWEIYTPAPMLQDFG